MRQDWVEGWGGGEVRGEKEPKIEGREKYSR